MTGRLFAALLVVTLVFRFWLAAAFPITGDEAYFIWWGWKPDWGYYDHPPMIGWLFAALMMVTDAEWWLRLPVILQPAVLALAVLWALPRLLAGVSEERRLWVATLILLAPVNVWNVFVTTDAPLIYFSVFSGLAWIRASRDDAPRWYLAAGLLLAGAVLSKYFAAILGFAYLVDVLRRRKSGALAGLAIAYACTLPALALMAWWNSGSCWPNYMFNFVNRHGDAGWSIRTPLLYAVMLISVLGPPVLWLAWRNRRIASAEFSISPALTTLAWLPFLLFAVLSLVKQIGLHWVLSVVPFTLIWLALRLNPGSLRRLGADFRASGARPGIAALPERLGAGDGRLFECRDAGL
ncbi:MAG: glycosyltransferase family 39 protein [Sulfuritalea sp.]|nr:glycosyltransferase family 39 protein [Sulfuritalea sp.]